MSEHPARSTTPRTSASPLRAAGKSTVGNNLSEKSESIVSPKVVTLKSLRAQSSASLSPTSTEIIARPSTAAATTGGFHLGMEQMFEARRLGVGLYPQSDAPREEAYKSFLGAAREGDIPAMVSTGLCCKTGNGLPGGRPNPPRALEWFREAVQKGRLAAQKERRNLCPGTQAACYNLSVCLRENIGGPLREDGTYRFELNDKEAEERWEAFKEERADWMRRNYRTPEDFKNARERWLKTLRRREKKAFDKRMHEADQAMHMLRKAWRKSVKWTSENSRVPYRGGPSRTSFFSMMDGL